MNYTDKTRAELIELIDSLQKELKRSKRELAALQRERTLLQTIIDSVPDRISAKDTQGRYLFHNKAHQQFLGATDSRQIIGKTRFDFFPEQKARHYHDTDMEIMRTGEAVVNQEELFEYPDGGQRWHNVTKVPVRDEDDKIVGLVTVSRDVTESRKNEETLKRERSLLRTLIDNIPDHIFIKDRESRFILANNAVAHNLDLPGVESVLGKSDHDFFPAPLANRFRDEEQRIMSSGIPLINLERSSRLRSGVVQWHATTKIPLKDHDGKVTGLVGINRDITTIKKNEEALARERDLLRTLIDNMPDFIFVKDAQGRHMLNNAAMIKLLGHAGQDDVLGKTDFDLFPPPLAEASRAAELEIAHSGSPILDKEEELVDSLGTGLWVSTTKVPLYDQNGVFTGIVGISRDITDRKHFEDAILYERHLLHTLMDYVPDSIYFKDDECNFIRVNKAWAARRKLADPAEAVGRTDFDFFPEDLARQYYDDELEIMNTGKALIGKIERIEMPGVPVRWISITKVPIIGDDGRIMGTCGISREITKLIQIEENLAFERDLLHTLLENVPDSIYFKDMESRYIRVSKGWLSRRGVADPAAASGKTDFDYFPPELAKTFYEDEQEIIRTGRPLVGKIEKVIVPGAPIRWSSITKVPIFDRAGGIIGTCGISRDITQLVQAEEELAYERDLLHTLMDYSPDHIYFKDLQSRFVRVNRAMSEHVNVADSQDVIGKTDFDFFPPEHAKEAFTDEQKIIQTGQPITSKIERESAPGQPERWALTSKGPFYNHAKEIIGTFGTSRDITVLKLYENELQKAKTDLERRVEERTAELKEANEGLQGRLAQLDYLTSTSYDLAQYILLQELTPAILHAFTGRFEGSAASFCLQTPEGFSCLSATGGLDQPAGITASQTALAAFRRVSLQRPFMVVDWTTDDDMKHHGWPAALNALPCYMVIPLLADNRTLAIVQVFAPAAAARVYTGEEQVLNTLGAQAAIGVANAMNFRELGEKARLAGELDAARNIQQSLTPRTKPAIPRVDVTGVYSPAFEVGGDYLDYFQTDQGNWVLVVADVCGKGVPAALLMTVLRSTFRIQAKNETSPKRLLCAVNESMQINLDDRSFVTALCLIIEKDGSQMRYARAGHPKMLRAFEKDAPAQLVETEGIALGLINDAYNFAVLIDEITLPLAQGDRFLIYTDGMSEARTEAGDFYGTDRAASVMGHCDGRSADAMSEAVMTDIRTFLGSSPFLDDLTILALTVTG